MVANAQITRREYIDKTIDRVLNTLERHGDETVSSILKPFEIMCRDLNEQLNDNKICGIQKDLIINQFGIACENYIKTYHSHNTFMSSELWRICTGTKTEYVKLRSYNLITKKRMESVFIDNEDVNITLAADRPYSQSDVEFRRIEILYTYKSINASKQAQIDDGLLFLPKTCKIELSFFDNYKKLHLDTAFYRGEGDKGTIKEYMKPSIYTDQANELVEECVKFAKEYYED